MAQIMQKNSWTELCQQEMSHRVKKKLTGLENGSERCWCRANSFVPIQWETPLLCNDVYHWLGSNLESALWYILNIFSATRFHRISPTILNDVDSFVQKCSISIANALEIRLEILQSCAKPSMSSNEKKIYLNFKTATLKTVMLHFMDAVMVMWHHWKGMVAEWML